MKTDISIEGKTLIVQVTGEIDHHSACEIKTLIMEHYSLNSCVDIIFDFGHLYFMDSAGIGMLIGRYKQVCINGGNLYAVGINPAIERIFELSGLNKLIKRCPSIEEAINANQDKREVI